MSLNIWSFPFISISRKASQREQRERLQQLNHGMYHYMSHRVALLVPVSMPHICVLHFWCPVLLTCTTNVVYGQRVTGTVFTHEGQVVPDEPIPLCGAPVRVALLCAGAFRDLVNHTEMRMTWLLSSDCDLATIRSTGREFCIHNFAQSCVCVCVDRTKRKHTYTHGWLKSCWRTLGCRHCSWGGKASQWCFGWCCRVGQRTWRRCAPAPWNAWTAPLKEMDRNRNQTVPLHLFCICQVWNCIFAQSTDTQKLCMSLKMNRLTAAGRKFLWEEYPLLLFRSRPL